MGKQRVISPVDPFESNKLVEDVSKLGTANPAYLLPQKGDTENVSNTDLSKYTPYMDGVETGSLFNDKTRAENQSGWEQMWNSIGRMRGEVIGGAISGFGATGAFFTDMLTEGQRQDADFNNIIMQYGEDIMKNANEANPIYRKNPGKAFDFEDFSGYFWENMPSVASSLSMLIPSRAITGGLGMLGKMAGISQKMGKTAKFLGEVGTMAVVSRNAENMRESLSVAKQASDKIKEQFAGKSEGEIYALMGASEVGKKFLQSGKEVNVDNFAKFVGAEAGQTAYKVNSANIAFDFIQTAIAYKALSGLTRSKNFTNLWLGESAPGVARAEAEALGKTWGLMDRAKEGFKSVVRGSVMGVSEGVEEMINAIGTEEGNRVANQAVGEDKSDKDVNTRLKKYLGDENIWDQGFWGFAGGKLFEAGAHVMEKAINPGSLEPSNRLGEIANRTQYINKITEDLKNTEALYKDGKITQDQYQDVLAKIGNQSAFDMGINAASTGQVDNLLHSVHDPAFKNVLLKNLSAEEAATFSEEKYHGIINNLTDNILAAEEAYKNINTKLTTKDYEVPVHNYILNRGLSTSFDIIQREKDNVHLDQQFEQELGNSKFSANSADPNFRNAIELEALGHLKSTFESLKSSGKLNTEFIDRRLNEIKDRQEVLKTLEADKVPLNQEHEKLVALKYQQLGNNLQIQTNKEANDKLFTKDSEENIKKEMEEVTAKVRKQHKENYISVLQQAEKESVQPEITEEELKTFNDPELISRYNRLIKKLEENKVKEEQLKTTETESTNSDNSQIEEQDDTIDVPNVPVPVVQGAYNREGGLEKVTPQQKERFLNLIDTNYASKNIDQLERYKQAAIVKGLTEEDGFIKDINAKIKELTTPSEKLVTEEPIVEETVKQESEVPVIEDTTPDVEEEGVEETTVQEIPVNSEPAYLQAEKVVSEVQVVEPVTPIEEAIVEEPIFGNINTFVPNVHNLDSTLATKDGATYKVSTKTGDIIKALKSINKNEEYKIAIDPNNEKFIDTKEDIPIAVYVNDIPVLYIHTETSAKNQLAKAISGGNAQEILKAQQFLASVSSIRNKIYNNKDKVFTTKITEITTGVIIPGTSSNPLDVIAGSWKLAYVDPQNPNLNQLVVAGESEIYYGSNKHTIYNADGSYTPGVEYLLLEGFNFDGTNQSRVPIRIHRNNLKEESANEVLTYIEEIVQRINAGEHLNSENIEYLKSKISEITPVNKFNQDRSELNGKIYYTIPKPYFRIHNSRIEFLFDADTKLATIWFKDKRDKVTKLVIEEWKSDRSSFANDKEYLAAKGKVIASYPITSTNYKKGILKALQNRPYNVVYSKNGLSHEKASLLLSTGYFRADFGVLADKTGNLTNFWAKPEKSLVDGVERYQRGNFKISIDANIKNIDLNKNNTPKGFRQLEKEGLLENIGQPLTIENITKALNQTDIEQRIIDNQKLVTKTEEAYIIDGESYKRVSNVIGNTFTGDSSLYKESTVAGNTIDGYVRDFFMEKEIKLDTNKISSEAFDALKTRLEGIKAALEKRGEKFLTSNIVVFDKETRVAGEIDILAVNDKGEFFIYDVKTSINSTQGSKYTRVYTGNGISRSKKDQQEFQTSAYEFLFEKQYKKKIKTLGILPFLLEYDSNGTIRTLTPEPGIKLKYRKEVEALINNSLPVNEKAKNTLYDDTEGITFDDGLTMIFTNDQLKENTTKEEKQKNWERMFGENVPFDASLDNLIRVKGELAYGIFTTAGAKLYKDAPMGTEYHEAFHAVTQLYLSQEEINKLYEDATSVYGDRLTRRDLEERLAEDFRLYAIAKDNQLKSPKFSDKIKNWFDRIWSAIKTFVGIKTKNDIFSNIYSGNFNYKPTSKVMEFIKKNPLMMEVNDLNAKFTQSDIKQYVEWATMIVAADLPIVTDKTNKEISENPNQFNLRLRVKARLAQYSKQWKAQGNFATMNAIDSIAENWGDINSGFWSLIVQNVRRKLNYNIGLDESEANDFQGNVQLQKDWDDRVPYSKSGKESFDFDLKRIIMLTPKLDNTDADIDPEGNITFKNINIANSAKLKQPIDFNLVYPMLVSNMVDANSVEEMMERLKALTEVNPSMYYLYNKVNNDELLKQKWFTNFRKNFVEESHIRFSDLENEGYDIVHDQANKPYSLADKWVNQLQVYNSIRGTGYTFNGYSMGEIEDIKKSLTSHLQAKNIDNALEETIKLGHIIGVDIDKEILTKLINNPQLQEHFKTDSLGLLNNQIINNIDWIVTRLLDSMKLSQPFFFSERGRIKNIADLVSYYMPDVVESSYINTQGKMVYSVMKPSYLSEFFSKIQAVNNPFTVLKTRAKEELLSEIKERLQDKSFQFSNWIFNTNTSNGILNLSPKDKTIDQITIEDLNYNALKSFSFFKAGDIKQTMSGYGASYTDLSNNDWLLSNLVNYAYVVSKEKAWAMYPIIIPSDSGNIWAIKAKRFKYISQDNNLKTDTNMFRALENIVKQEMMRMEIASNLLFERIGEGANKFEIKPKKLSKEVKESLIIGYHYKNVAKEDIVVDGEVWFSKGDPITIERGKPTGSVFNFQNMDYNVNGKIQSLNNISELKIGNVFSRDLLNSKTKELIQNHILGFVQNEVSEELKRHLPFKEVFVQSKIKSKEFLEFWSNNYETLIAEYAINSYIFNIEQANFFNGVIQEYKNGKDTAKRAKQVSTTKQTTSYTFRGPTYQAIIIKDILLDAKELKSIEENLTKYVTSKVAKEKALSKFKNINIADAQGYITLDRLEKVLKDWGRWDKRYARVFEVARNPNLDLKDSDLGLLLEVMKPFSYGRNYDSNTGVFSSKQIKTSLLPLIPKLIKGTELELLASHMEKNDISEVYFESAFKVGRQMLSDIHENGKLKEDFTKYIVLHTYQNKDWGLQLDVPSHLKDEENKLGVQIAKITLANLSNASIYKLNGETKTGGELISLVQDLMSKNIKQSSEDLIEELGIEKKADGYLGIKDLKVISDLLKKEISTRGLSKNFTKAVEIKNNDFIVPLSGTNLKNKFMSILSSLFTGRVTNQKFPGGHVVVASPAMLNYSTETGSTIIDAQGIEFIDSVKPRIKDGKFQLNYLNIKDDKITKVEALLPSWSKDFFKKGQRVNINELSEELRTMIGYRIPTEGKYSAVVLEVVGFLPESNGSTIILPYELVAQTGWDFDVDSVYLMQKTFKVRTNGKEAAAWIAEKTNIEVKQISKYINEIRKPTQLLEVPKEVRDLYIYFMENATEYKVIQSGDKTTESRNNQIFDIFESILSNPESFKELVSGGNFNDLVEVKNKVEELLDIQEGTSNIYTRKGQDNFRNTFMAGRALKGMAANANSALAVLQNVGAKFRDDLGFKFKYTTLINNNYQQLNNNIESQNITDSEIEEYYYKDYAILEALKGVRINTDSFKRYADNKLIKERLAFVSNTSSIYLDDLAATISEEKGIDITPDDLAQFILSTRSLIEKKQELKRKVAELKEGPKENFKENNQIIKHNIIANNAEGTFTNVEGNLITDTNAQSLAMSLDIVKEGFPYNLNTYTFNTATAMVATGVPWMEVGLYIRQPAINRIAEKVMNNTSVLDDIEEREIKIVAREYQAALYQLMFKEGLITKEQAIADKMWDKAEDKLNSINKMKIFMTNSAIITLGLDPFSDPAFSKEELAEMIKMDNLQYRKAASPQQRIKYFKDQLDIINQWSKYYNMGQEFAHVVANLNADKLGAGPDLNITPNFFDTISRKGVTDLYYNMDNSPVIVGNNNEFILDEVYNGNKYPVFKAYLEHSNLVAFESFFPLFLESQTNYRALKNSIKGNLKLRNTETVNNKLDKFLFKALYQKYGTQVPSLEESKRLLGLEKEIEINDNLTFEEYSTLSTAEKLMYVQRNFKMKDGVLQEHFKNTFDILNRLTPKLEESIVQKRQMHSIEFNKPKASDNIDDFIIESFNELLNTNDSFLKSLADDLIDYDFFINGLSFNANSWREYIPMETQIDLGIGRDMKKISDLVSPELYLEYSDMFMKNNWNDINIVPIANTKYQYDEKGNRLKQNDEQTYEEIDTIDSKFFDWDSRVNTLQPFSVSKKQLKLEKQSIKNSPYLLVRTKSGERLLKRYMYGDERDKMSNPTSVWYYPVNKLGSRYIGNEVTDKSILEFNNLTVSEDQMIQFIENNQDFLNEQGKFLAKKNNEIQC